MIDKLIKRLEEVAIPDYYGMAHITNDDLLQVIDILKARASTPLTQAQAGNIQSTPCPKQGGEGPVCEGCDN